MTSFCSFILTCFLILSRLSIPPFASTESVIEPLQKADEAGVKTECNKDFLRLCHTVSNEVINLSKSNHYISDKSILRSL